MFEGLVLTRLSLVSGQLIASLRIPNVISPPPLGRVPGSSPFRPSGKVDSTNQCK